mmetsp:Transcript_20755/g.33125  ORF Transcript_20755/g.33125 Transcript_20755/m.33125 type:complete len:89 (-) Transcript_20755:59-325(-)
MAVGGADVPGPRGPEQFLNKQLQQQLNRCPACGGTRQQQSMLGVVQSDSAASEPVCLPAQLVYFVCLLCFACSLVRCLSLVFFCFCAC